jgi:VTC domain
MSQALSTRETRDFARELKFLVDLDKAARIREWARTRLSPDPYASGAASDEYRTTSLYLDTSAFDVFHRRGSYGRSKYRIRRYGAADVVFVERKLRTSALLTKRRTIVAIETLRHLEAVAPDDTWAGAWFQKRMLARQIQPRAQVAYHRTARVGLATWGPMRLTLDDDIRAAPAEGFTFQPGPGVLVVENQTILELKFRVEMPATFKHLVEEFALETSAISKYRLAVPKLGLAMTPAVTGQVPETRHA